MKFSEYEEGAASTAIYPGQGTALGLMYVALKMNGEAGEFAEHLGKSLRDDGLVAIDGDSILYARHLTNERRELLIKEAGDLLWYVAAAARELGSSLDEIAKANLDKLAKRKAEGKLGGSGDNR